MGRLTIEQRKREFFAQVERCIRIALLVPKAEDINPANIDEAEMILRELNKERAELDRLIERERKLS